MSANIFDPSRAIIIARKYKISGEKIILVGGCFDILHIGHLKFLEAAKHLGGILFILLESDEKVKKLKGKDRPIFKQADRAEALSLLRDVDSIVKLPYFDKDSQYQKIVEELKPDILVVTENDPILDKKRLQAAKIGSKFEIISYVNSLSSSKLADILSREHI